MSAKKLEEILEETQVISSMISEARRLLAEDKSIDLTNLYNKISILCKKAQSVGANQKSKVHYILREIVEDFKGFSLFWEDFLAAGMDFLWFLLKFY